MNTTSVNTPIMATQSNTRNKAYALEQFHALGSTIEFCLVPESTQTEACIALLKAEVEEFERRFSRFQPTSELSLINAQSGVPVRVTQEMLELFLIAQKFHSLTGGLFNPLIAHALSKAGYSVSFERISDASDFHEPTRSVRSFSECQANSEERTITLPKGLVIDFGGIGKGFLADSLQAIVKKVTADFCLSLGGDLVVSGKNEHNESWVIQVQDPFQLEKNVVQFRVPDGSWGIATSGIGKRNGMKNDHFWHHIIDPRTGKPSTSDVLSVTVIAPTTVEADVFAKTAVILGAQKGYDWITEQHAEALIITKNKQQRMTSGMKKMII